MSVSKPHSKWTTEQATELANEMRSYKDTTGAELRAAACIEGLVEQLEAAHRGMQQLIIKNDRLGSALDAADRLLDDVHAKGGKYADDLLRRTQVSSALADSNPAKRPE